MLMKLLTFIIKENKIEIERGAIGTIQIKYNDEVICEKNSPFGFEQWFTVTENNEQIIYHIKINLFLRARKIRIERNQVPVLIVY